MSESHNDTSHPPKKSTQYDLVGKLVILHIMNDTLTINGVFQGI